jgi:hypothetical protein
MVEKKKVKCMKLLRTIDFIQSRQQATKQAEPTSCHLNRTQTGCIAYKAEAETTVHPSPCSPPLHSLLMDGTSTDM